MSDEIRGSSSTSDEIKWSRFVYCGGAAALTTFLIMLGASPWFTVPLGAFAAWWTFECTRALWTIVSFRVAIWRLHQLSPPSIDDIIRQAPRKAKRWEWLSNPRLHGLVDAATIAGVAVFPAVLWLPLILWLLVQK
jgi:hypothetical protein